MTRPALLCIVAFLAGCNQPAPADCTATFYGDSILHGAWSPDGVAINRWERYPAAEVVAQRPRWKITDRTQNSQSLSTLMATYRAEARNSRFVVIESGVIDSWANQPVKENLTELVNLAKAEGRKVILTGFSHQVVKTNAPFVWITKDMLRWRASNNAIAHQIAVDTGSGFAAFGDAAFNGSEDIADALHPTQEYSLRLTAKLIAALDKAAPECKGPAP